MAILCLRRQIHLNAGNADNYIRVERAGEQEIIDYAASIDEYNSNHGPVNTIADLTVNPVRCSMRRRPQSQQVFG